MRTYPSKVDWWFATGLLAAPVIALIIGIAMSGSSLIGALVCILMGLFMIPIIFLLAYPCGYTITEQNLIIRSGAFYAESIPLSQIRDAQFSSNPLSAPALSLRRIKISLPNGYRLISPINREEFIAELLSRAPAAASSGNV